jgi:2-polyprenyl-6-methoxyphenol hydroxylase-like FAD-dependent oxidoreductase
MSRPLLEHVVRQRAGRIGNVSIRPKCNVREIIAAPGGAAATGVRYENSDGIAETGPADLVVDASGRGLPTLAFLEAHGHPLPEETSIGVDMRYATAVLALPKTEASDWSAVISFPDPRVNGRGGLLFPIEGGQWMLAIGGANGDAPPADIDGFKAFAASLRTPTIYNAIRDAAFIGEIARFAFPGSVHRHFERLTNFPKGLLPVADAVCRFNPAFGQGMSVAAIEACTLKRLLKTHADRLAPAFFSEIQSAIETPWAVAKADFIYPRTTGERPADFEATMKFQAALTRLAAREQPIHKLLVEVRHLLKPGSVYRDPALAQRVMAEMQAQP